MVWGVLAVIGVWTLSMSMQGTVMVWGVLAVIGVWALSMSLQSTVNGMGRGVRVVLSADLFDKPFFGLVHPVAEAFIGCIFGNKGYQPVQVELLPCNAGT